MASLVLASKNHVFGTRHGCVFGRALAVLSGLPRPLWAPPHDRAIPTGVVAHIAAPMSWQASLTSLPTSIRRLGILFHPVVSELWLLHVSAHPSLVLPLHTSEAVAELVPKSRITIGTPCFISACTKIPCIFEASFRNIELLVVAVFCLWSICLDQLCDPCLVSSCFCNAEPRGQEAGAGGPFDGASHSPCYTRLLVGNSIPADGHIRDECRGQHAHSERPAN